MKCYALPTVIMLGGVGWAFAASNVDNTVPNKFGWGENVGWTNWYDANGAADGVNVGPLVFSGLIWGENVGWINVGDGSPTTPPYYANLDDTDFGVNIDPDGDLHGLAWGENIGWINFDGGALAVPPQPARVECDGRLNGYIWGENVGWINLSDLTPGKFVALDAAAAPLACDVNQDGTSNGDDIQVFINLLMFGGANDWLVICAGDVGAPPDGIIDAADVADFISCLLN